MNNFAVLATYFLAIIASIVALCVGITETYTWLVLLWIVVAFLERLSKCFVIEYEENDEDEQQEEEEE